MESFQKTVFVRKEGATKTKKNLYIYDFFFTVIRPSKDIPYRLIDIVKIGALIKHGTSRCGGGGGSRCRSFLVTIYIYIYIYIYI